MNGWTWFAIITIAGAITVAVAATIENRRESARYARHRLVDQFMRSAGWRPPMGSSRQIVGDALTARGWTVDDVEALGAALTAGINGQGTRPTETVRADTARVAADFVYALLSPTFLTGSTVREQTVWMSLMAVHNGTDAMAPLVNTTCSGAGSGQTSAGHGYDIVQTWHDTLGPVAPYAIAAGLTFEEATAAATRDELGMDVLMAMAALRGIVLPAPADLLAPVG